MDETNPTPTSLDQELHIVVTLGPKDTTSSNGILVEEFFLFFQELKLMLMNRAEWDKENGTPQTFIEDSDTDRSEESLGRRFNEIMKKVSVRMEAEDKKTNEFVIEMDRNAKSVQVLTASYHRVLSALERQLQKTNDESKRTQLVESAKMELYRVYLVELYGENIEREIRSFAVLFNKNTPHFDSEIELFDESLNGSTSSQSTQPINDIGYNAIRAGGDKIIPADIPNDKIQNVIKVLGIIFPIFIWMPSYCNRKRVVGNILHDILAGITVAIVLCPQGVAYAIVAGMPAIYGLYTAFIPCLLYPFLGTSRVLAAGPSVIVSIVLYQAMHTQIATRNQQEYIAYVLLASMIGGAILLLSGILRLGFLINFLSKPILSGFTSGAAILIIMTQIKYLFGVHPVSDVSPQIYWSIYYLGKAIFAPTYTGNDMGVHWPTLCTATLCFFFLLLFKHLPIKFRGKKYYVDSYFPSNLIVIIGCTAIMSLISLAPNSSQQGNDIFGIAILGPLPLGLPVPAVPKFYKDYMIMNITTNSTTANGTVIPILESTIVPVGPPIFNGTIFLQAFLIALPCLLIGFAEAYSVGSTYAQRDNYVVDSSQELVAIGTCAFIGSFFSAYAASTSFSRSAVNAQTGARSQLAGLLTGVLIFPLLLILTRAFYYLPFPLLGSMIIVAVFKLIDFSMIKFTFKTKKRDCFLWFLCFICTLFAGVQWGIAAAVGLSFLLVVYRASRPRYAVLGREPGTMDYRSIKRYPRAIKTPAVLVIRFDCDFFFANSRFVMNKIQKQIDRASKQQIVGNFATISNRTQVLVLDMISVNQIDAGGVIGMKEMKGMLDHQGIELVLSNLKPEIYKVLLRGGFIDEEFFPKSNVFPTIHDAVCAAMQRIK